MLVLEQEHGLMGLSCQLHLFICLKSSLSELSPDHAHSVNIQENLYHSGLICWPAASYRYGDCPKYRPGNWLDFSCRLKQMGHVWQFHHPPYQVIYLVTLTVKLFSGLKVLKLPKLLVALWYKSEIILRLQTILREYIKENWNILLNQPLLYFFSFFPSSGCCAKHNSITVITSRVMCSPNRGTVHISQLIQFYIDRHFYEDKLLRMNSCSSSWSWEIKH